MPDILKIFNKFPASLEFPSLSFLKYPNTFENGEFEAFLVNIKEGFLNCVPILIDLLNIVIVMCCRGE